MRCLITMMTMKMLRPPCCRNTAIMDEGMMGAMRLAGCEGHESWRECATTVVSCE